MSRLRERERVRRRKERRRGLREGRERWRRERREREGFVRGIGVEVVASWWVAVLGLL